MQILPKLFLLLINIDQETVLKFFGVEDPNIYLNSAGSLVSTEISLETLKLVFQGILERYQDGLGLLDVENIILFITFIRFIILSFRYNIKTSFYISCISLFAGMIWYFHLKDLYSWYTSMLVGNRLTSQMAEDSINKREFIQGVRRSNEYIDFINEHPLKFFKQTWLNAVERDGYRIDPISMLMTKVPAEYKASVHKIYYSIFNNALPTAWSVIDKQLRELSPILLYLVIVRLNKKYCPYLIRWHWTFLFVFQFVEEIVVKLVYRLWTLQNYILIPQGKFQTSMMLQTFFMSVITIHYVVVWFGLLHATCGQYFYMPFIVENTEIHIGKRPQASIYSGGYTSWQDGNPRRIDLMVTGKKRFVLPRIWWGWFGKSRFDIEEKSYRQNRRKRLRKKRSKGFKKLIRRLKKWILKS